MSEKCSVSFNDLLNLTFQDGSVHIKHLESLFKILVTQLELGGVNVYVDEDQSMSNNSAAKTSEVNRSRVDPILKVMPRSEDLARNLCKNDTNPMLDMLNLLNITKRVEALEISIHTLTSMMGNVMNMEKRFDEKLAMLKISAVAKETTKPSKEQANVAAESLSISSQTDDISMNSLKNSEDNQSAEKNTSEVTNLKLDTKVDDMIRQQIAAANKAILGMISKLSQDVCDIQKNVGEFQDKIDDLMFACEQNDGKVDETLSELKDFNSKIFCLKSDVKTLMSEAKEFKEKFVSVDEKYETMNNLKTNKSYVDECLSYKAFNLDLEKFIEREDIESVIDIMRLKFGLMEDHFSTLQINLKKSMACFKSEMDEKLEKNELMKFKKTMSSSFQDFLNELKALLLPVMKNQVGLGGKRELMADLNCISCEANISMKTSHPNIPQLKPMCDKFMNKLDKSCMKSSKPTSNIEFRRIFGTEETKPGDVAVKAQQMNQLNFPYSQPCFILSQDNTIVKADPLKCLNNPKYFKP